MLAFIISFIIIIFPLFVSFYVTVDKNGKILKTTVAPFGITVFNFLAKLHDADITIKHSFKKKYEISCLDVFKKRGGINLLKGISILKVRYIVEAGFTDDFFLSFMTVAAFDTIKNTTFNALKEYKPFLDLKGDINMIYGVGNIRILLYMRVVLNLLTVLVIFIKYLSEKIKNAIGK